MKKFEVQLSEEEKRLLQFTFKENSIRSKTNTNRLNYIKKIFDLKALFNK